VLDWSYSISVCVVILLVFGSRIYLDNDSWIMNDGDALLFGQEQWRRLSNLCYRYLIVLCFNIYSLFVLGLNPTAPLVFQLAMASSGSILWSLLTRSPGEVSFPVFL